MNASLDIVCFVNCNNDIRLQPLLQSLLLRPFGEEARVTRICAEKENHVCQTRPSSRLLLVAKSEMARVNGPRRRDYIRAP